MHKITAKATEGPALKIYYSPKELSVYLSLPLNTIYAWTSQRRVPHRKIGRLIRFNILEIEEWLHDKKVEPSDFCKSC
jgi:excisionase family DNA binding protein